MSFTPEDRGAELRALFFESANELLQSLNESGLELEARPADEEVIRSVRRVVHTLKGDSAACGFTKLSEIAHELEDVLTQQTGKSHGAKFAEIVLVAADTFEAMLSAYQRDAEPPSVDALRVMIRQLLHAPASSAVVTGSVTVSPVQFDWSEYEQLMISEAIHRGETVFNVALRVDQTSGMRAAAFQLIRNVLHGCGTVIALRPEDNAAAANVEIVEAALATKHGKSHIEQRCSIPAVVARVWVEESTHADAAEHELLGDLLDAQAAQVSAAATESSETSATKAGALGSAVAAVSESTLRVDASRIDSVMNLVGELIIGKSMLNRALTEFDQKYSRDPIRAKLDDDHVDMGAILVEEAITANLGLAAGTAGAAPHDELHKSVLKIRMVPVEQLFRRFPRVVRDVAKHCGKDVALELAGENTDLDKGILDALAEPMTHIVRNAVDHGIESSEARIAAGKGARSTISLNAYHQGTQVVIEVRDDGHGLDLDRIRKQAIQKGLVKAEEAGRLLDSEVTNFIFEPGFSECLRHRSGRRYME